MLAARYFKALARRRLQPAGPVEDTIDDKPMPLLDHLVELRSRMIWSLGGFIVAFFLCYLIKKQLFSFLAEPLADVLRSKGVLNPRFIYTAPTEAFFTYLKISMFGAAFISFPVVATQIYMFVAPGMYRSEKNALRPFLIATPVLFVLGAALAYYFIFPTAFAFFVGFGSSDGAGGLPVQLETKVSEYLGFSMKVIFAFGIAFQLPVLLTLLAKVGIISVAGLKKYRRYAYVGMFVVAAVLTPPDIITQCGLALPLIALYELSIVAARIVTRPKPEAVP